MLLTAGLVAIVFGKLKQPIVLGYILAGFLVGPHMPYFFTVADMESIDVWSEIGIIVLMFGLGLEFNLHKLLSTGRTAVITALTEVVGMLLIGYFTGQLMGWTAADSLFLGGMLSMSSTTIIIKAFDDLNVKREKFAQLVFGILVIEDIAGIFMMVVLSTVSASQGAVGPELALQLAQLVLYLAIWLIAGIFLLPTLLDKTSEHLSDETLLLISLGVCFGMVLLAEALGFSSALSAFLAGSLLAGTIHAERAEHLTSSIKDLFGAVFFLSVGMLIDPQMIVANVMPVLIITLVTLVGKVVISSLGVVLSGQGLRLAVRCGASLGQIGEFAFIIASLGMSLGVLSNQIYPIIVAVSVITTLTTPACIKSADTICDALMKALPAPLIERLRSYTADENEDADESEPGEWAAYIKRFASKTALFGIIMLGIAFLSRSLLYPALVQLNLNIPMRRLVCAAVVLLADLPFIRPMMDLHSSEYTALWVTDRKSRIALITLNALRFAIVVLVIVLPIQQLLSFNAAWLVPAIAALAFVSHKSGWLISAYLKAETRFVVNLNERRVKNNTADDLAKLADDVHVARITCPPELDGRRLMDLSWGRRFNVNAIKIEGHDGAVAMPVGSQLLHAGDRISLLGKQDDLRSLGVELGFSLMEGANTLEGYLAAQQEGAETLFTYTIPVSDYPDLQNKSIKGSSVRDHYNCMVLAVLRNKLPVLLPHVNMVLQDGDYVWMLGSQHIAELLLMEDEPLLA